MDEVVVITKKWRCVTCCFDFENVEAFGLHNNSKEHEKAERKKYYDSMFCNICNFQYLHKKTYDKHFESNKHNGIKTDLTKFYCKVCEKQLRCKSEFDTHIQTKLHLKRNEGINYNCEVCKYSCKLTHLWNQHCKTEKHLKSNHSGETTT